MPSTESRRAVLYARVSELIEGRKSVDDQLSELRVWARRDGWQVVAEHRDDGISASRFARRTVRRDGWQQTMDLISAGSVDILAVWELSRASRDRAVWAALLAACEQHGVLLAAGGKLHDPGDPDDAFMVDLGAALSSRESAILSKRVRRSV
ncbi:MAG TPA: recombinase family protein, partial [Pseudonocardiaceae bacterium]|nr:recombinase family protein [Pseudonocardiaceae bacterium]